MAHQVSFLFPLLCLAGLFSCLRLSLYNNGECVSPYYIVDNLLPYDCATPPGANVSYAPYFYNVTDNKMSFRFFSKSFCDGEYDDITLDNGGCYALATEYFNGTSNSTFVAEANVKWTINLSDWFPRNLCPLGDFRTSEVEGSNPHVRSVRSSKL